MSNTVTVIPCQFVDYDTDGMEIDRYWGYRIYDSYGMDYNNNYATLQDVLDAVAPENILTLIADTHSEFYDCAFENGVLVGTEFYEPTDDRLFPDGRK